jgi:shikimate dehydrogenase
MPHAYVLGSPIGHSLSPVLHRAAYAALGLTDWTYSAEEVDLATFGGFVADCGEDVRGLSLTMPLKEIAFTVVDHVSDRARLAGAINTLVRREGGWFGDNTDIAGIVAALTPPGAEDLAPDAAGLILGAGATARSAVIALDALGATRLTVAARSIDRARDSLLSLTQSLDLDVRFIELTQWPSASAPVIVSTLTPAGGAVAAQALSDSGITLSGCRLLDVGYAEWPTPLARAATAVGAQVVSGLDMLVHQAVEQVDLMTGARPDPQVLLPAGRAAIA